MRAHGRAPNDLPARGNFGKRFAGLVSEVRAGRISLAGIAGAAGDTTGARMAGSTVNSIVARAPDAMKPEAEGMPRRIGRSRAAGLDGTPWNDGGSTAYVGAAQSGDCAATSTAAAGPPRCQMQWTGSGGVATTDGYGAYAGFDADGRRRACRAHHLRETKRLARKHGGAVPPETRRVRQELQEGHNQYSIRQKLPAAQGAHSPRLRSAMDLVVQDMPAEYRGRGKDDPGMIRVLGKVQRQAPRMFAFLEHPGIDPTNNASEGRRAISWRSGT